MGEVVRMPGGPFVTHRTRIDYKRTGVVATLDSKNYPSADLIAEIESHLERLFPLLVECDAVLIQFGPEANVHPLPAEAS